MQNRDLSLKELKQINDISFQLRKISDNSRLTPSEKLIVLRKQAGSLVELLLSIGQRWGVRKMTNKVFVKKANKHGFAYMLDVFKAMGIKKDDHYSIEVETFNGSAASGNRATIKKMKKP